jgi:hypothetical protein
MDNITTTWKNLANLKQIQNYDVAAYCIAKAIFAKSNEKLEVAKALLFRSFSPITKESKLNGGNKPFQSLLDALAWNNRSVIYNELDEVSKLAFNEITRKLLKEEWQDKTYAYILVRQDLPPIQQVVQAAHVAMVLGQQVSKHKADAKKQHFCVLALENYQDLLNEISKAKISKIPFAYFFESDIGQFTAMAYHPMRKSYAQRKKLFTGKSLLTLT